MASSPPSPPGQHESLYGPGTIPQPDCSKYVLEYQVVCDMRFVGAAKLEHSGTCAGGDNDLAATEEASSR